MVKELPTQKHPTVSFRQLLNDFWQVHPSRLLFEFRVEFDDREASLLPHFPRPRIQFTLPSKSRVDIGPGNVCRSSFGYGFIRTRDWVLVLHLLDERYATNPPEALACRCGLMTVSSASSCSHYKVLRDSSVANSRFWLWLTRGLKSASV